VCVCVYVREREKERDTGRMSYHGCHSTFVIRFNFFKQAVMKMQWPFSNLSLRNSGQ
jgi:hypothetical protein